MYSYVNVDDPADEIEIHGSMKDPPPWDLEKGGKKYTRKLSTNVQAINPDYATKHRGAAIPVSHSMPRDTRPGAKIETEHGHSIKVHKDGIKTDMKGNRIIDGKQTRDRNLKTTGFHKE